MLVGSGTGFTALVLAAIVTNRWFEARRGVVIGVLTAANATGQLLFLPLMATLIERYGWRAAAGLVGRCGGGDLHPGSCVITEFAGQHRTASLWSAWRVPLTGKPAMAPLTALAWSAKRPAFWLLAGSFFICGASTNGLIGTHLIPACHDYGISEVRAAGLLAAMGIFDIIGTTASGWLTDRFASRYLLTIYYALRGLSLLFLPSVLARGGSALAWFAVFYGLDWIATVPPTVRLTSECFGRENTGVVYGWIGASHQFRGASLAAMGAGTIRTIWGSYQSAFWIAGMLCFLTALLFLNVGRRALRPALSVTRAVPAG